MLHVVSCECLFLTMDNSDLYEFAMYMNTCSLTYAGAMIMIEIERGITGTDHVLHHLIDQGNHLDLAQKGL